MRPNTLRALLQAGKPTLGTHLNTMTPALVEAIGHAGGYDYVEFLAEYAPHSLEDLDNFCRAAELHGLSSIIKVDQSPRGYLAQRAIGSGFQGVLFADCRTVEDVRECVRAVRPDTPEDGGTYGAATRRFAYPGYGATPQYVQALRDVVIVLMVEKAGLVDCLEEALAVPGIDMIQWGPSDYSMSIGRPGQGRSAEIKAVERRVIATALKMGIPPRAEIHAPDDAQYYLDLGVRHFCMGWDFSILYGWWKTNGEKLRSLVAGA
jgi:4-hydroxy-2-oxoheptanedioate aldolase